MVKTMGKIKTKYFLLSEYEEGPLVIIRATTLHKAKKKAVVYFNYSDIADIHEAIREGEISFKEMNIMKIGEKHELE
jgi:hypothetical protein